LRVGIARGRSYASILVIPRRKMSLCEAPHGRRPWPNLKLHESSWELTGEGKEKGKERRGRGRLERRKLGGGHGGRDCKGEVLPVLSVLVAVLYSLAVLREEERERKEERRRKERRKRIEEGKEKKRKKYGKFSKLEFF
jgi:hypothetical protein